MNKIILRIAVIVLLIASSLIVLTDLGAAQDSRRTAAPIKQTEKPVDEVFKNIKVLNGVSQSQLYPTMRFMATSLGFQCGNCHVIKDGRIDAPLDDKPEKQTAREMIKMVIEINKTLGEGRPTVSCYTCHRGQRSPQSAPALPLPLSATGRPTAGTTPSSASVLPSVDDVLNKYSAAIGGKSAIDRIKNLIATGTTTIFSGQVISYETEQLVPDKGHESFAIQTLSGRNCAGDSRCEYERIVNGQQGWVKSGAGVQELVGQQVGDQRLSFPLFEILRLSDQYASFRMSGIDKIDDRATYVVTAVRADNKSESLYFDVESGLLRRRISYIRTLIGKVPQQTDLDDYREVEGVRLPFTIKFAFADPGSLPITRKFTQIQLNVLVDGSQFEKPR